MHNPFLRNIMFHWNNEMPQCIWLKRTEQIGTEFMCLYSSKILKEYVNYIIPKCRCQKHNGRSCFDRLDSSKTLWCYGWLWMRWDWVLLPQYLNTVLCVYTLLYTLFLYVGICWNVTEEIIPCNGGWMSVPNFQTQ